jgi:hypothetical protein
MMSQRVAKAALHRCLRKSCLSNPNAIGRNYSVGIHAARTRTRTGSVFLQNRTNSRNRSNSRDLSSYGGAGGTVEMEDLQDLSDDNDAYQYYPNRSASVDDIEAEERKERMRQAVRDEIDTRTGRLWEDPWALTDDDWSSGKTFEDLPDWTEEICSRVSRERVKVHPGESIIDTSRLYYCIAAHSFWYCDTIQHSKICNNSCCSAHQNEFILIHFIILQMECQLLTN